VALAAPPAALAAAPVVFSQPQANSSNLLYRNVVAWEDWVAFRKVVLPLGQGDANGESGSSVPKIGRTWCQPAAILVVSAVASHKACFDGQDGTTHSASNRLDRGRPV
jgi:hypothetical protein